MTNITITKKSWSNLKALHAGIYCIKHSFLDSSELLKIQSCLKGNFEELDREKVPYTLQNMIIHLGEVGNDILDIKEYYNLTIQQEV